ncbi:hypothetical protein P3T73_12840 [Kiritimatiellota bacterium B12222]|nr:hypothetical protein P3T73_12840 [Kiritimatiellota bacterium B12222]
MNDDFLEPKSLDDSLAPQPDVVKGKKFPYLWVVALLVLLGLLGIWMLSKEQQKQLSVLPTPTAVPLPSPTPDPELRAKAESAKAEVLALLGPLRATDPERWAAESWLEIESGLDQANEFMLAFAFEEAESLYADILLPELEALTQEFSQLPEKLMPQAVEAYAAGDAETSVALLSIILYVDSENAAAKALLPRAKIADQSFALLTTANTHAEASAWELAWQDLNKLSAGDPAFPGVASLKEKVESEIYREELESLISQTVAALAQQDLEAAEALLQRAAQFDPKNPMVVQLQQQVSDQLLQQEVLELQAKAVKYERDEAWSLAHKTWLQMKSLDPEAPWVEDGLQQSLRWKIIDEKITRGLAHPASEQSGLWIEEFKDREGWPMGLRKRADDLEALRMLVLTPVEVRLLSDFETEVSISKVGRWSPFKEKTIQLKPGSYVAKGGRFGYRDVRITFEVKPGQKDLVVEVVCREGI